MPWMAAGFLVALAIAAVILAAFSAGKPGTVLALRLTARWGFLLFWPAYAGSALAKLFGRRFGAAPFVGFLARRGREFGLAFAAALCVHIALVLWLLHIEAVIGDMIFFWGAAFAACLLALFSVRRLRDALAPPVWRVLQTIALDYIALAFAADFIVAPLRASGLYKPTYLPFAALLIAGGALRLAAFARGWLVARRSFTTATPPRCGLPGRRRARRVRRGARTG